ncbi:MAG: hypothetical protein GYA24_21290 [Candidatus Lokiarchaeota archaeon]|nr:hypothetical protein [Candidatus Lokiarchaeota archaeon]
MKQQEIDELLKEASISIDGFSDRVKMLYNYYREGVIKQKQMLDSFFTIMGIIVGFMMPTTLSIATLEIDVGWFFQIILLDVYAYIFLLLLGISKVKGRKFDRDIIDELKAEKDEEKRVTIIASYCKHKKWDPFLNVLGFGFFLMWLLLVIVNISIIMFYA